jgi:hypothetical protein
MVEKKKKKASKERLERRFIPEATHTSRLAAGLGMAGSLILGAGVYGQWMKETPLSYAAALVTVGAAGLGTGLWLGSSSMFPVRVGDAGVAIERGSEVNRILWCDMSDIKLEKGEIVVRSPALTLAIPVGAHPRAAAYLIAEAERRLPKVMKVTDAEKKSIPLATQPGGEEVTVAGDQVAGRRCAATDKIISFERDARLCPNCAQVYHKDNVPKQCLTCGAEVAGRTVQA